MQDEMATVTAAYRREIELEEQIEAYWDTRSQAFSKTRRQELAGPSAEAWTQLFSERLPQGRRLRILDIGTGAGFFSILLARLGHAVTGIDMSGQMVHAAKCNALQHGVAATFRKMNAEELAFADASFDVVVSRNLTWTLPDAMQAYREWHRVLKKGGLLLNFDSDYGKETFSKQADQANVHAQIADKLLTTCNEIKDELRISTHRRPQWDRDFLQQLGMTVSVTDDIGARVHNDPTMHYDNVALFALAAIK